MRTNPHTADGIGCGQFVICEHSHPWLPESLQCVATRASEKHQTNRWPSASVSPSVPPPPETNAKMSDALCIVGSFGSAGGQQDCGSCYLISIGSVIAIIASDIALTVFIAISVFCFASHHKRQRGRDSHDGRRSLPSSVSKKTATEVTESPYQELHGVQSDVYSELRHFRK
ncbi:TYRO protein tyrosine kinase-binding protein [Scophthalmus maximus]|uniref:TYRO protein tyrosine kinase-binding protein n=1 Tax=Scophthalmus maximus TaxID=52904 RepID=UPI000F2E1DA6|nr:TYRO protein tyrosine kinase-binding protein [Scophthalmus maximus]